MRPEFRPQELLAFQDGRRTAAEPKAAGTQSKEGLNSREAIPAVGSSDLYQVTWYL